MAARTAVDSLIDLRYTLRMMGAPVEYTSYIFGDNQSVIKQSTIPHSQLTKRHFALSYHRVCEAIAAEIIKFYDMPGKKNPVDILTKFLGYQEAWPHLKPLLFW